VEELTGLLRDELAVPVEVLPFPRHGTSGNSVVIWLGHEAPRD
jgi:hypothetical protein